MPVTVVSCSSVDSESTLESESSESELAESDSSDSDGLENWMLLGQGMQDGDQSISLNLEGGSVSSAGVYLFLCLVSVLCFDLMGFCVFKYQEN